MGLILTTKILQKYPHGEAVEDIDGVLTWTAYKTRWFMNAFGTHEHWTGLNDTSLWLAHDHDCTMVRFRLHDKTTKKLLRQYEINIDAFENGHHHLNQKDLKATVHVPVSTLTRL